MTLGFMKITLIDVSCVRFDDEFHSKATRTRDHGGLNTSLATAAVRALPYVTEKNVVG